MTERADGLSDEPRFPASAWEFDERVTAQFDEMLARSIPQLAVMRQLTFDVGRVFIERAFAENKGHGTEIVDLGCSRGGAVAPFIDHYGAQLRYTLIEQSEAMRRAAFERYRLWIGRPHDTHVRLMRLSANDITREELPPRLLPETSLVLSVLTLQFTPIWARPGILRRAYERLRPGGALLLVEKLVAPDEFVDGLMVAHYHDLKARNGYTREEIAAKSAALQNVMIPISAWENEQLLKEAGFNAVECYWRHVNFAAWVAVK